MSAMRTTHCPLKTTLCDNRQGLVANAMVTAADGYAGREAAKVTLHHAVLQ